MYPNGICAIMAFWPSPLAQKITGALIMVIDFFIPIIIFTFSYMSMYRVLQTKVGVQPETNQPGTSTNDKESIRKARARRNILKTLTIVTISFCLCWIWTKTLYLINLIGILPWTFYRPLFKVGTFLVYINICVNPFIYVIHYQQFRRGVGLLKQRIVNLSSISTVSQ